MLTPWKESYDQPDSILKSRGITLSTKVCLVKAMVFPAVMYGCENWTLKKAESQRIYAFEQWCWRRTVVLSPLDCKQIQPVHPKGDQSWVFIGRTDAEAETPILWPPHAESWLWCWEGLGSGGEGDNRGWDGWMASPTRWTWVWVNSGIGDGQGGLACCNSWGCGVGHDWTELNWTECYKCPRTAFAASHKFWCYIFL